MVSNPINKKMGSDGITVPLAILFQSGLRRYAVILPLGQTLVTQVEIVECDLHPPYTTSLWANHIQRAQSCGQFKTHGPRVPAVLSLLPGL